MERWVQVCPYSWEGTDSKLTIGGRPGCQLSLGIHGGAVNFDATVDAVASRFPTRKAWVGGRHEGETPAAFTGKIMAGFFRNRKTLEDSRWTLRTRLATTVS